MNNWSFVRHGESLANARHVLSGWQDVPLTEKGKKQAFIAGELLANQHFDLVLSSDLVRARHTAEIAMSRWAELRGTSRPKIQTDPRFRERNFKEFQGREKGLLRKEGKMKELTRWNHAPSGVESYRDLTLRILPAIRQWDSGGNCLLFAHGGVIRVLLAMARRLKEDDMSTLIVDNAKPHTLCISDILIDERDLPFNIDNGWTQPRFE